MRQSNRIFVEPATTLDSAQSVMKENGVGAVAIVNARGELVGFLQREALSDAQRLNPANSQTSLPQARFFAIIQAELSISKPKEFVDAGRTGCALCQRRNRDSETSGGGDDRLFGHDG